MLYLGHMLRCVNQCQVFVDLVAAFFATVAHRSHVLVISIPN